MSNEMIKAPSECQFHNNCGGWCETSREVEHNLCTDCLEAHDEDVRAKPEPVTDEGDTVQMELKLLDFALSFALCNRDHGGTRRDVKKAQEHLEKLRAILAKPAQPEASIPASLSSVPRYDMDQTACEIPDPDGVWVRYDDVAAFLQHRGKPVYQLRNNVLATNWRDADKAAYDSVGDNPSYERRVLYTHPAEQPVLASDQWPKLEKPALVGAGRFSIGLSARLVVEAAQRHYEYETTPENETLRIATGNNFMALLAQLEQLRGLRPAVPPRPPEGNGLPRYGLRWNGPQQPLATPMDDGYWTPWHLANELLKDAERYQWLRSRDLETISHGGVFAGLTPQNMVLNEETLDEAVDAAMAKEVQP